MSAAACCRATLRSLRRILACDTAPTDARCVFARQASEFERCVLLVRVVYVFAAFWMISTMPSWKDWETVQVLFPLWPLAWLEHVDLQAGLRFVCIWNLASAVAAAVLPHVRLLRIAATVGLLWWSALVNSRSGVVSMHGLHLLIWVSAAFVFLPLGSVSEIAACRAKRAHYARAVWFAQAIVLCFYSSGGFFKIAGNFSKL